MAWNDATLDRMRGPVRRSHDMSGINATLDESATQFEDTAREGAASLQQRISQTQQTSKGGSAAFEPAEFAMNAKTGEIALPNGMVMKADAPTILQLATLDSVDGKPLPVMTPEVMAELQAKGFRPYGLQRLKSDVDAIPTESDFFGEAYTNLKSTLGLAASAVDAMIGNDDPSNSWSKAQGEYEKEQSIGELKASRGRWYSSIDSFISGLGQTTGNVTGTVVAAIPVAAAVTGVSAATTGGAGAIPGGILGVGLGVSGGASAFGEQATEFYDAAIDAMSRMSPETLRSESPLYAEILKEQPGISHDEAVKEVAIRGSRAAGATAGVLGAVEGMVGGRLAGNFLARVGLTKSLLGRGMAAVNKRTGVLPTAGRVARRATLGGAAAAGEEMAETMLGQAAGASTTGIGNTDPMAHFNADEGWQAALGGGVFGALGGRARRDPVEIARESSLAQALGAQPDLNVPWRQSPQLDPSTDAIPAQLREVLRTPPQGPAAPTVDQRAQVSQQLQSVLAERFGPDWFSRIDQIAPDPGGRQLVGQLIALEQDMRTEQEAPAYERRPAQVGTEPVYAGEAPPQGALPFEGQPREQPMPQGPPVAPVETAGPLPQQAQLPLDQPPGLAQRRAAQEQQLQQAAVASGQNPALLEQSPSRSIEQQIFALEDQIADARDALAQRPARDPRKKFLTQAIKDLEAQLEEAEKAWVESRYAEGPTGVAPGAQVESPEPLAAPGERMPDGRPVGVTPPALVNPEPMSPAEAASRAQTQQERAGAASAEAATPADVQAAAAASATAVTPTTPEPAEDVAVQIEALADPTSERDAVFVASVPGGRTSLPDNITPAMIVVNRREGTLITTNPEKARLFRRAKLSDDVIAQLLGYSETKAAALSTGAEPVVVQARRGPAVAAEQVASPAGVPAAAAAVAAQAPKGAKVVVTSVAKAQADRAARATPVKLGPKGEAVRAKSRERSTPKKPMKRPATKDDDRTPAAPASRIELIADVVERVTKRKPAEVRVRGKAESMPSRMTTQTGRRGREVDLRTETIDDAARLRVGRALDSGVLSKEDRAVAEAAVRDFDQLETLMGAALKAAEDKLQAAVEAAPDGVAWGREATARQLEVEQAAARGERGRPRTKPRTSPLAYMPLLQSETRGFLKAMRAEAKAELDDYSPATSVARQMISAVTPEYEALLTGPNARKVLKAVAEFTDEQIEEILPATHTVIMDSTVPKQVMRGATEVAYAMQRMNRDIAGEQQSFELPAFANHEILGVERRKMPHVTEHGEIPAEAQGLVNAWITEFERGGNKFSAPVHVMSVRDAIRIEPNAFMDGRATNGKFIRRMTKQGDPVLGPGRRLGDTSEQYILAVDWNRFSTPAAAIEVLAHEFGHMVTLEMYFRADPSTRMKLDAAYRGWRRRQQGRSVDDVYRDQLTPAELAEFRGGLDESKRAYVEDFYEWMARNAALYVLDPNRATGGRVGEFFKKVGAIIRKLFAALTGPNQADRMLSEMLDRWIAGVMTANPMPIGTSTFSHDEYNGPAEPGANGTSNAMTRAMTSAISPLRDIMGGKVSAKDVREAMTPVVEGKTIDTLKGLGLSLLTMRQIERQYRDTPLGKPLSGWVRNQQQKAQTANRVLEAGSEWMEKANLLDSRVREVLERVMYEATTFAVHPDLDYTDNKHDHLRRGSDYAQVVNEKRYHGARALYLAAVKADPRVAEIYAGLRDAFTDLHGQTLAKQLELIETSNFSPKAKEQITQRIKSAQRELREGPYFPKMRFGDWIVKVQLPAYIVGKDGKVDGEVFDSKTEAREEMRNQRALNPGARIGVEALADEPGKYWVRVFQSGVYFFESEGQAKAAAPDIEREVREHYDANGVLFDDVKDALEDHDEFDGAGDSNLIISQPFKGRSDYNQTKQGSPEFMQEVRSLLNEHKIDAEVAATLERLAIESLPENNYRQSMLPRQNVFGASKQMLRAYAHRFQGAANHYAVVEHGKQINANWQEAWEVNRVYAPAGRVLNVLAASQKAAADRTKATTTNAVMNVITDASSTFSLAFSPAYVLMNSLQPWTVSAPVLAGQVNPAGRSIGMAKSMRYLKAAYSGALPFFTKRGIADFINEAQALAGKRAGGQTLQDSAKDILTRFGKTPEESAMLESLLERGTLDFSWLNSLEDAMRGGVVGQKWAALQRMGMAFPQQVEAMNRVVTALAAYRMARDENLTDGSEATLQEFADDMVADTQLDYSRSNRPLAFNQPGLNVILQFKLYMQGMYMLFGRHAAMALRGATPEERKQGRRTVAYLMLSHAAAAGAAGLGPIAAVAKLGLWSFAQMVGDDDDEWKSGNQLLREMMTDLFGEYGGVVMERGLPAMIGVDMSDRLGIPMLIDARYANIREDDPTGTTIDKWVLYSLGAPYANFKRVTTGAVDLTQGEFGYAINGLPSGARAMARSVKWAKEGIVDRDGDTFIPRDDLGWRDLAISTMGLTPLKTGVAYSERTELKRTTARIINERKELMQAYRTASDRSEARAAIRDFNDRVPEPFRIDSKALARSLEAKAERDRGGKPESEAAVEEMLQP